MSNIEGILDKLTLMDIFLISLFLVIIFQLILLKYIHNNIR